MPRLSHAHRNTQAYVPYLDGGRERDAKFPEKRCPSCKCQLASIRSRIYTRLVMPSGPRALRAVQIDQFIEHGFVRVDDAFPRAFADAARAILWADTGCAADVSGALSLRGRSRRCRMARRHELRVRGPRLLRVARERDVARARAAHALLTAAGTRASWLSRRSSQ